MYKVLIVGYGIVGYNIKKMFPFADIYDPLKGFYNIKDKYDYCIICVPTEKKDDGSADVSVVELVIEMLKDKVGLFIIKSTIPPGTTDRLIERFGIDIVFSPEYYGNTQHANTLHDFVIFGGTKERTSRACQLWQEVVTGYSRIMQTDSVTAELVKYAENTWLAMQVTFSNEFYRICKEYGSNYPEFRELLLLDERISRSHTFVYENHPYYDSHCLNKDLPAIVEALKEKGFAPKFIEAIIERNEEFKLDK